MHRCDQWKLRTSQCPGNPRARLDKVVAFPPSAPERMRCAHRQEVIAMGQTSQYRIMAGITDGARYILDSYVDPALADRRDIQRPKHVAQPISASDRGCAWLTPRAIPVAA